MGGTELDFIIKIFVIDFCFFIKISVKIIMKPIP